VAGSTSEAPDDHTNRAAIHRRLRDHIAQLTAVGFRVTVEPAA
jgi:transposase